VSDAVLVAEAEGEPEPAPDLWEECRSRFRAACRSQSPPTIESLIDWVRPFSPEERAGLLVDLVVEHLRHGWEVGRGPLLDDYVRLLASEFEEFTELDALPIDLIEEEFIARHEFPATSDHPAPEDYERRFPRRTEVAARLKAHCLSNGRYILTQLVGEGGSGSVREAYDKHLGRYIAVKFPLPRLHLFPEITDRFEQEARLAARLEHPSIVTVHELGCEEGKPPFCVMRLVQGHRLIDIVRRFHDRTSRLRPTERNMRWNEMLRHFIAACNATAFAHSRGVIHCDLKPQNIVVGAFGETIVVDWGLAKAVVTRASGSTSGPGYSRERERSERDLSETGSIVGTLPYMSPEQAEPVAELVGPRSDVYSLGATLYHILTGQAPFEDDDAHLLRSKVINGQFRAPREIDSSVSRELDAIVCKAMSRAPSDRYAKATALADDVAHWLADEPVSACKASLASRAGRWARRHRSWVASGVAVLLLSLVGVAGFAVVIAARNRELAAKHSLMAFFSTKVVAAARPTNLEGGLGSGVTLLRALDTAEPSLEQSFAGEPELQAAIRYRLAETYYEAGEQEKALRQFVRAADLRARALGPDNADTLEARDGAARLYLEVGRVDDAVGLLEETLRLRREKLGPDHADTIGSTHNLAMAYNSEGRQEEAAKLDEQIVAWRSAHLGPRHPDTLYSVGNLASVYRDLGRFAEAKPLFLETVDGRRVVLGHTHRDTLLAKNNLANFYREIGWYHEAISLHEETLAEQEKILGPDDPDTLLCASNLGLAIHESGGRERALPMFEQLLKRRRAKLRFEHPETIASEGILADAYLEAGRLSDAIPLLEGALAKRRKKYGENRPPTLRSKVALARAYLVAGRLDDTEPLARGALTALEKKSPGDWRTFHVLSVWGGSLLSPETFKEAEQPLRKAYEGMKAREATMPASAMRYLFEGAERVSRFYELAGNAVEAKGWRAKRDADMRRGVRKL
jgi:tetratricopeptide (TPR) repeat protein